MLVKCASRCGYFLVSMCPCSDVSDRANVEGEGLVAYGDQLILCSPSMHRGFKVPVQLGASSSYFSGPTFCFYFEREGDGTGGGR